ncbi:Hypothetical_protein [Hexamita inflata]|uniref:Hypothetical_protein n=1 Tax=Hexamita inflata TaxID=28002 RepID=A0AA86U3R0_9EUKA|nr:Hypothetical protein HINF_LOCUS18629 [Hexamita inflata]CAI9939474.1 Hypothetical protein HINF_LOCUS27119 [Hexamita inflata]
MNIKLPRVLEQLNLRSYNSNSTRGSSSINTPQKFSEDMQISPSISTSLTKIEPRKSTLNQSNVQIKRDNRSTFDTISESPNQSKKVLEVQNNLDVEIKEDILDLNVCLKKFSIPMINELTKTLHQLTKTYYKVDDNIKRLLENQKRIIEYVQYK